MRPGTRPRASVWPGPECESPRSSGIDRPASAATKAAAIKIPTRKGSSAPSVSAPNISATAPSQSFTENLTDDINTDTTAAAINNQSRGGLRAYVVLDDIDSQTATRDLIEDNATL